MIKKTRLETYNIKLITEVKKDCEVCIMLAKILFNTLTDSVYVYVMV